MASHTSWAQKEVEKGPHRSLLLAFVSQYGSGPTRHQAPALPLGPVRDAESFHQSTDSMDWWWTMEKTHGWTLWEGSGGGVVLTAHPTPQQNPGGPHNTEPTRRKRGAKPQTGNTAGDTPNPALRTDDSKAVFGQVLTHSPALGLQQRLSRRWSRMWPCLMPQQLRASTNPCPAPQHGRS